MIDRTELLVFGFDPPAGEFEGRLIGALERAESGGALKVLEALFVRRDPDTLELSAMLVEGGTGGLVSELTRFRLDRGHRRDATAATLAGSHPDDAGGLRLLGDLLEPGAAVVAVRVEHAWASTLGEAVARSGGRALADDVDEDEHPPSLVRRALAVARRERALRPI
jgi:hypothetical protein